MNDLWGEAIDKWVKSLAIDLYIAKTFHQVWQRRALLLSKLCGWTAGFLHERRIRGVSNGCVSRFMSVNTCNRDQSHGALPPL